MQLMNKLELINLVSESKELRRYCLFLTNKNYIHDDIYQTFLIELFETNEDILTQKYKNIEFIGYCKMRLWCINKRRIRDSKLVNTKNTLVDKRNTFEPINIEFEEEKYNHNIDLKFEKTIKFIKKQPKEKQHILFQSVVTTTRQIASELGVKQITLIKRNNKFKSEIKQNVK